VAGVDPHGVRWRGDVCRRGRVNQTGRPGRLKVARAGDQAAGVGLGSWPGGEFDATLSAQRPSLDGSNGNSGKTGSECRVSRKPAGVGCSSAEWSEGELSARTLFGDSEDQVGGSWSSSAGSSGESCSEGNCGSSSNGVQLQGFEGGPCKDRRGNEEGVSGSAFGKAEGQEGAVGSGVIPQVASSECADEALPRDEWKDGIRRNLCCVRSPLDLGILLHEKLLSDPAALGVFARFWLNLSLPMLGGVLQRNRDVLPLPPPALVHIPLWKACRAGGGRDTSISKDLAEEAGCEIWSWLIILGLNLEFVGRLECTSWSHPGVLNASQVAALGVVEGAALYFQVHGATNVTFPIWKDVVDKSRVDYNLDETFMVVPLKLGELLPGLPAVGVAGTLLVEDYVSDEVRRWLLHPEACLKPKEEWPVAVPRARMQVETHEEWHEIGAHLGRVGIMEVIDKAEIFCVNGVPVLNSFFSIEKKGAAAVGQLRVTRLIFNMVPSNSYFNLQEEDLGTLTPSTSWVSITLADGKVLLWSGDDQRGAFFIGRLPKVWRAYMTACLPVPG
jgi:hypothetical protein